MSNHYSSRGIELHHSQVDAGRGRRKLKAEARLQGFLTLRRRLRFEHNFVLACGFLCFAYTNLATAVYLGSIV